MPWTGGLLWAWWPVQPGGKSSAQSESATKPTPELQSGMNHTSASSLCFVQAFTKVVTKATYKRKTPGKTLFIPTAATAPSFKSPWTQANHCAATGCKSNAQGWQRMYWQGSGTTFSLESATDGPCRAGMSAFSCDLAEDALVARV